MQILVTTSLSSTTILHNEPRVEHTNPEVNSFIDLNKSLVFSIVSGYFRADYVCSAAILNEGRYLQTFSTFVVVDGSGFDGYGISVEGGLIVGCGGDERRAWARLPPRVALCRQEGIRRLPRSVCLDDFSHLKDEVHICD